MIKLSYLFLNSLTELDDTISLFNAFRESTTLLEKNFSRTEQSFTSSFTTLRLLRLRAITLEAGPSFGSEFSILQLITGPINSIAFFRLSILNIWIRSPLVYLSGRVVSPRLRSLFLYLKFHSCGTSLVALFCTFSSYLEYEKFFTASKIVASVSSITPLLFFL